MFFKTLGVVHHTRSHLAEDANDEDKDSALLFDVGVRDRVILLEIMKGSARYVGMYFHNFGLVVHGVHRTIHTLLFPSRDTVNVAGMGVLAFFTFLADPEAMIA